MEIDQYGAKLGLCTSLLTVATVKVIDYFKAKKGQNQEDIEDAKQEIIAGIKAYDAEHESTEDNTSVE